MKTPPTSQSPSKVGQIFQTSQSIGNGEISHKIIARDPLSFFEDLLLPKPNLTIQYETSEGGFLIPLNPFGCLIRLTDAAKFPLITREPFLLPIGTKIFRSNIRADLFPGIVCPVSERKREAFNMSLRGKIDIFKDLHEYNLGQIPGGAIQIVEPDVLSHDFKSLSKKRREKIWDTKFPEKGNHPYSGPYGALRKSFETLWPEEKDRPDPASIVEFWKKCVLCKEIGILKSAWNRAKVKRNHKYSYLISAGKDYGKKIANHPPLEDVFKIGGRYAAASPSRGAIERSNSAVSAAASTATMPTV
jgi:hypothetical protein